MLSETIPDDAMRSLSSPGGSPEHSSSHEISHIRYFVYLQAPVADTGHSGEPCQGESPGAMMCACRPRAATAAGDTDEAGAFVRHEGPKADTEARGPLAHALSCNTAATRDAHPGRIARPRSHPGTPGSPATTQFHYKVSADSSQGWPADELPIRGWPGIRSVTHGARTRVEHLLGASPFDAYLIVADRVLDTP
jgi:hypothetical protein